MPKLRLSRIGAAIATAAGLVAMPLLLEARLARPERQVDDFWETGADQATIRALSEHSASRLLADCRHQKVIRREDQERADKEWLPRALAAGLKRFAIVLPNSVLAAMNVQDRLGNIPSATLDIAYFEKVEEAKAWLAL